MRQIVFFSLVLQFYYFTVNSQGAFPAPAPNDDHHKYVNQWENVSAGAILGLIIDGIVGLGLLYIVYLCSLPEDGERWLPRLAPPSTESRMNIN